MHQPQQKHFNQSRFLFGIDIAGCARRFRSVNKLTLLLFQMPTARQSKFPQFLEQIPPPKMDFNPVYQICDYFSAFI